MTSETMPLFVTSGVGVGVLAGVISGVLFLFVNGVNIGRRLKLASSINRGLGIENRKPPNCSSCNIETQTVCSICNLPLCKECNVTNKQEVINCLSCISEREYFFDFLNKENGFITKFLHDSLNFNFWSANHFNLNQIKASRQVSGEKLRDPKEDLNEKGAKVREYLQQMAESLAGGSIDQVSISRMYQHPEYLPVIDTESINNAQAKLQQLVQRVIEEALRLPALLDYSGLHRDPKGRLPEFNPKTYEDLLATAILNKVIDRYQQEASVNGKGGASSSGVHSGSSSPAGGGREIRRRSKSSRGRLLDSSPDRSSLEPASHDDYEHSDSSGRATDRPKSSRKYSGKRDVNSSDEEDALTTYNNPVDGALSNINFNKKSRTVFPEYGRDIIEVQDSLVENPEDISFHSDNIYTNNNSWEENWLFQKRKIKTNQSVSVPMLVPSSNTECRAMIGDKEVDDTSDLSDAISEAEMDISTDIKHVLVDSKTVIGGKNSDLLMMTFMNSADDNHNVTKDINKVTGDTDENSNTVQEKIPVLETVKTENKPEEPIESVPETNISKNVLKDFLKELESSESDSGYGVTEYSPNIETPNSSDELLNEATNLDVVDSKESENHDSLGSHQQESEYTETVARPVQRHMDSLKRQHNIKTKPTYPTNSKLEENEDEPLITPIPATRKINSSNNQDISLPETIPVIVHDGDYNNEPLISNDIPILDSKDTKTEYLIVENIIDLTNFSGTIADREHKKWLNAVPMENNPYSPEAIKNRLNKRNHLSMFDIITSPLPSTPPSTPLIEDPDNKEESDRESVKSNPKPLQEVFSEKIPEYKRYGRDYYINESKRAAGARKKTNDIKLKQSLSHSNSDSEYRFNDSDLEQRKKITRSNSDVHNSSFVRNTYKTKKDDDEFPNPTTPNTYRVKPVMIEDVDSEFDDIYQKAFKIENGDHDIYMLPVDSADEKTSKILEHTNGILVPNTDLIDQTDSFNSSIDDCLRIYNIQSGKIMAKMDDSFDTSRKSSELFRSHEDLVLPSSIKSWKSMNDVCWDKHEKDFHKFDMSIDENLELPSVKDLAKKFFIEEKYDKPIIKPKRRISRELLDNSLVSKSFSNSQQSLRSPMYMHSLTARSISKEFRDELKMSMPANTIVHPGGSKHLPDGSEDPVREGNSRPDSPIPEPGSLRNKLAFFEKISKTSDE